MKASLHVALSRWPGDGQGPGSSGAPSELVRLLRASTPAAREDAWSHVTQAYGPSILRCIRLFNGGGDLSMERYAYVLERLRADDFRRLREYAADGRATFPTWLVVVTRRLCLDYERRRCGQVRPAPARQNPWGRTTRRPLVGARPEGREDV